MLHASTCLADMQRLCFCHEVEEAEQIYLLMKEEYRISRNVRLAWFLGKLNQVIRPASKTELVRKSCLLSLSYDDDQTLSISMILTEIWFGVLVPFASLFVCLFFAAEKVQRQNKVQIVQ